MGENLKKVNFSPEEDSNMIQSILVLGELKLLPTPQMKWVDGQTPHTNGGDLSCVNLTRLQVPVIYSNTNLGIPVRYFVDVIKIQNQLTLSKGI